jgi:hypothetical protein
MTRLLVCSLALGLAACASEAPASDASSDLAAGETSALVPNEGVVEVGDPIPSDTRFLAASEVVARAADLDGETVAVEGQVSSVCQNKGCWLTIANDAGETFRVSVPKDDAGEYLYTFPTDIASAQGRFVGTLSVTEESVEMLRHLAEDAGQSADEIAAIDAPKRTLALTPAGAEIIRPASDATADRQDA